MTEPETAGAAPGFILKPEEYWWPVTVHTPDGGTWRTSRFEARFRLVDLEGIARSRLAKLEQLRAAADVDAGEGADELDEDASRGLLRETWIGWRGIADEDGDWLSYSEPTRDALLRRIDVRRAVWAAFLESIGPHQDALGNS